MQLFAIRAEMKPEAFTKSGPEPESALVEKIAEIGEAFGMALEVVLLGTDEDPDVRRSPFGELLSDRAGW